jgi:hypothetical protein
MVRKRKLSRGVAIVGGGLTKLGLFKERNSKDFFADAFVEMIESVEKGFNPGDIHLCLYHKFSILSTFLPGTMYGR